MNSVKNKKSRIGIIFGGLSSESEVSLAGGRNVYNNIDRLKFGPIPIYWDKKAQFWQIPEALVIRNTTKEIEKSLQEKAKRLKYEDLKYKIDLAFLVTHGKYGDDGCLQGLLELLGIPYTGSGVLSAALGMDKPMQRKVMKAFGGINAPDYLVFSKKEIDQSKESVIKKIEEKFGYQCVTKPTREGSTFGVFVIKKKEDFDKGFEHAFKFDNNVLIEKYIKGREFSCIVIGNDKSKALLPTETIHKEEIFTYDAKYLPGASEKETPINIDEKIIKEIQDQCEKTYKALGCKVFARMDGFVDENNKVLITDPNSGASTGMGPSSWTFHQAAKAGMNMSQFITKLIELAIKAHKEKKGPL